ncbi:MAG TPA: hypothetical protein VKA82_18100 [Rubrobacter sp.]|jgi:hypothetical protein|nr:hypothetical protein [Rubrobacter sp.]
MTSRSTLDLHTLGFAICAYSVGGVGENHRTERCPSFFSATSRAAELEMRAAEEPLRSDFDVAGLRTRVLERVEELEARGHHMGP